MEDPWAVRIENTFINVGPKRSPSLDRFYQERQERSCPSTPTYTCAPLTAVGVAEVASKLQESRLPVDIDIDGGMCCSCNEFGGSHDNFLACAICCCMEPTASTSACSEPDGSDVEGHHTDNLVFDPASKAFHSKDITFDSVSKRAVQKQCAHDLLDEQNESGGESDICRQAMELIESTYSQYPSKPPQRAQRKSIGKPKLLKPNARYSRRESKHTLEEQSPPQRSFLCIFVLLIFASFASLAIKTMMHVGEAETSLTSPSTALGCMERPGNQCDAVHKEPVDAGSHVSFDAFQKLLADVKELFGRLEKAQPLLRSESMLRDSRLFHDRFAALLHKVKRADADGENIFMAAQDAQLHAFHKDLVMFVERAEGEITHAEQLAQSIRADHSEAVGSTMPASDFDEANAKNAIRHLLGTSFGHPAVASSSLQISAHDIGFRNHRTADTTITTTTTSTTFTIGNVAALENRMQSAFGSIVSNNKKYETLQLQVRSLGNDLIQEIMRRGQQFDEALFMLQQRGSKVQFASDGGIAMHGSGSPQQTESVFTYWQYVVELEAFVQAQIVFLADVERVLR